jgi:hypothetical protein
MFRKYLVSTLIICLIFSIVVIGAPNYVNLGPTSYIEGDVGVPAGKGYYVGDVLFSTLGLIDISTLAKTDGGIIVGDGTNFVLETGITARTSLELGNVENLKVKLDAATAPGDSNDNTEGYAVGSRWVDVTNDKEYVALDVSTGAAVWTETTAAAGGYTNLTQFVGQTEWRLFYSNADGDVVELPFGTAGQYLKSTGATSAPIYDTPAGAGTVTTSGTPEVNDIARFTGATVIEGLTYAEFKTALDLEVGTDVQAYSADNAFRTDKLSAFAATTEAELYIVLSDVDEFIEAGDPIERNYYSALDSDNTYSGNADVDTITVGESVTFGDLLYHKWSDHEYYKAQADAYATARCEVIALEAKGDGDSCLVLRKGYIRDDNAFDFGAVAIFLNDDTAGTCDDIAPEESGDQIQIVGTAKSADILFFNPSMDVGEI